MGLSPIYTMLDLVSLTGVNRHTIRAWITRGVIPKAYPRSGPHAVRYGEEHIKAIRRVQDALDTNVTFQDLRVRYKYKPANDGFDEDFEDDGLYTSEEDVMQSGATILSLEELQDREVWLNEDDEEEPEWSDTRVHEGWYR